MSVIFSRGDNRVGGVSSDAVLRREYAKRMTAPGQAVLRRHGAAPIWTPASLFAASEQGGWYDPSDMSTMFQDSAGTVPVTAAGQSVGRILDKSGNGNHATQASAVNKPILQESGGLYYLQFDGVDDFLSTGSIDFTSTDKMTVVAGLRKLSDAATGCVVETQDNRTAPGGFGVRASADASATYDYGCTGAAGTNTAVTGAVFSAPRTDVISTQMDIGLLGYPSLVGIRVNSVAAAQTPGGAGVLTTGTFGNKVLYIGRVDGSLLPFNGHLYQLVVRGAATPLADIEAAESFTADKTGVTL